MNTTNTGRRRLRRAVAVLALLGAGTVWQAQAELASPEGIRSAELPLLRELLAILPDDKPLPEYRGPLAAGLPAFPFSTRQIAADRMLGVSDFRGQRPDALKLAALKKKAALRPLRVLVTLAQTLTPEGLLGAERAGAQRRDIADGQARVMAALGEFSGAVTHQFSIVPMLAMKATPQMLDRLAQMPEVAGIVEDHPLSPQLDFSVPLVGGADVQDRGVQGNGWVVAVLDTGIDRDHPFLRGFVGEACFSSRGNCPNGQLSQIGGGAGAACSFNPAACDHGTHVSGIAVGASMAPSIALNGMARGATLMPVQVFSRFSGDECKARDSDPSPPPGTVCPRSIRADLNAALQYVYEQRNNFRIAAVNLSLGGVNDDDGFNAPCDSDTTKLFVDQLRSVGIATVIAAGNNGLVNGTGSPGCISTAITVGATDDNDAVAGFSNSADFVDVLAPGVDTLSSCGLNLAPTRWCFKSGTSMAAPHVAGAIALLKSQRDDTVAFIDNLLKINGVPVRDSRNIAGSPNRVLPRIQLFAASGLDYVNLAEGAGRSYRGPRPLAHHFQFSPVLPYWSAIAARPSGGADAPDLNMALHEDRPESGLLALSNGDRRAVEVIATDHNSGRRPVSGIDFPRVNLSGPGTGRYDIEASQPGQILGSRLELDFDATDVLRIADVYASAFTTQYLRAVPEPGQDIELLVFDSFSGTPSSWVRSRGDAASANAGGGSVSEELSYLSIDDDYKGVAVVQYGGSGRVTLYRDTTAPNGSVLINDGAALTTQREVELAITASDPDTGIADMRVTVDGNLDGSFWQAYTPRLRVKLAQISGTARVVVQLRNNAGQTASYDDSIETQIAPVSIFVPVNRILESGNRSGNATSSVSLRLAEAVPERIFVDYTTRDGSALNGSARDYLASSGRVEFAPGQTEALVLVTLLPDRVIEDEEIFFLDLSNPSPTAQVQTPGEVSIIDDDSPVVASISDVEVAEPISGSSGSAPFTVTLSRPSADTQTFSYRTVDGSARAGSDYTAASGTLRFLIGETTRTFTVPVLADGAAEPTENFSVELSAVTLEDTVIGRGTGTAFVRDFSNAPRLSLDFSEFIGIEGNSGTSTIRLPVTLSPASSQTVTVQFSSFDDSALAGSDYVAASETLTFAPGQTLRMATLTVNGDIEPEADEYIGVRLDTPTGGAILSREPMIGFVALPNDDDGSPLPSLSVNDISLAEGNDGTPLASFRVTLSAVSPDTVSVTASTVDGTALAGSDYNARSVTLSFSPGQTVKIFNVSLRPDTQVEPDETFLVRLTAASGASIGDGEAVGTVLNDDGEATVPQLRFINLPVNVAEGPEGSTTLARFDLQLSAPASGFVSVDYETYDFDQVSDEAVAGEDYFATRGTISFAPGTTARSIEVTVRGDDLRERYQTFGLRLSRPVGTTLPVELAAGGILNDDTLPAGIAISDASLPEGSPGLRTPLLFRVTLTAASPNPVTVRYRAVDGSAIGGSDYVRTAGTVSFAPGEVEKQVSVLLIGDRVVEADELFAVRLFDATGAELDREEAGGHILDDDANPPPALRITDVSVVEGASGTQIAAFKVRLSRPAAAAVTVTASTVPGTALARQDYSPRELVLTFNPGEQVKGFNVAVRGDTAVEPDEVFGVQLTAPSGGAVISDAYGQGTIVNDD